MRVGAEFWAGLRLEMIREAYGEMVEKNRGGIKKLPLGTIDLIAEMKGVSLWDVLIYAGDLGHLQSSIRISEALLVKIRADGGSAEELATIERNIQSFKKLLN